MPVDLTPEALDALEKRLTDASRGGSVSLYAFARDTIAALRADAPVDPVTEATRGSEEFDIEQAITDLEALYENLDRWSVRKVSSTIRKVINDLKGFKW